MKRFPTRFIEESELNEKQLKKLFIFFDGNPIRITENHDGVKVRRKKLHISVSYGTVLEAVLHEMAHIAEIPARRLLKQDYGLKSNGYEWMPAMERELRVFAYEANIFKYLDFPFLGKGTIIEDSVSSTLQTSDTYAGQIEKVESYCLQKVCEYQKIYTIQKFKKEWNLKMEFLKSL